MVCKRYQERMEICHDRAEKDGVGEIAYAYTYNYILEVV